MNFQGKFVKAVHQDKTDYKSPEHKGQTKSPDIIIEGECIKHGDGFLTIIDKDGGTHDVTEKKFTIKEVLAAKPKPKDDE